MTTEWLPTRCLGSVVLPDDRFSVQEELELLLSRSARAPNDRKTHVYHPSAIGGPCKRVLYYQRIGAPETRVHSTTTEFLFKQGHAIHDIVQDLFENIDDFISEVTVFNEALHLYGNADGLFLKRQWLLEVKTIGEASYRTLVRPQKRHLIQAHCYMYCLDIPRIQFLYINRNNLATRMFRVQFNPALWEETILPVLQEVEALVQAGTPPPEAGSRYECSRCQFQHVCEPAVLSDDAEKQRSISRAAGDSRQGPSRYRVRPRGESTGS